jgi:hypothetical protein
MVLAQYSCASSYHFVLQYAVLYADSWQLKESRHFIKYRFIHKADSIQTKFDSYTIPSEEMNKNNFPIFDTHNNITLPMYIILFELL